jgi:hypothetical protein
MIWIPESGDEREVPTPEELDVERATVRALWEA